MVALRAATSCLPHELERQRLLAASMRIGMMGMCAVTPLGAFWLVQLGSPWWACLWAAATCTSALLSKPLAIRVLRARSAQEALTAERIYAFKMLLSGGLWGGLALWPGASELDLLALGILQFLILIVSCVSLAASRHAFPLLLTSIVLPLTLRLLISPPAALPLISAGLVIAALVLAVGHFMLYRTVRRVVLRRQQRDSLAREQEALFHAASEGILLVREACIVKCNWQGAAMLGSSPEQIIGTTIGEWLHESTSWPHYLEDMRASFSLNERFGCIARLRKRDGECFFAELSANPLDADDLAAGVVLVTTDISVRLANEAALRSSEQRFRRLLSLSSDWYWEQDAEFRFTQLRGARMDDPFNTFAHTVGKLRWELDIVGVDEQRWATHRATLEAHLPFNDFTYQLRTRKGELRWLSVTGHPVHDEAGHFCGYHGIGTDITENIRQQERYHHLAHHDTLTGLPNRRLLMDRLDQSTALAKRNLRRVAVMLLDLDNFKVINDTDGHSTGDRVLVAVAERLRGAIREADTLSRLGGDEFVVLLPAIESIADAEQVASKITATLTQSLDIGGSTYVLGVSVGIAIYPDHTAMPDKLLSLADAAMYQAKQGGGNQYRLAQLNDQGQLPL
ncbi:diguanylate cyclase [Uliginosibacterium sp. H3]|uniref:Diguanylate cyclase n=1 Tax=Uliginosibacterium silvisoli TaxID=3114758 RepID=A0ABU6K2I7_9RHOO|nr:diguanylate cyclase [Uliginosibacterium sp. H3]